MSRTFVGFGFGAIQAGLFIYEAARSGNFERLVAAEVAPDLVDSVRRGGGRFSVNIAEAGGIKAREVAGVEIFNPAAREDREALIAALAEADEIATALPSVKFFCSGGASSVAQLLADSLKLRLSRRDSRRSIIYTAENDNHAAEQLESTVAELLGTSAPAALEQTQFLNTVIGKMSGVVTDEQQIREQQLARMAGQTGRCLLVEEFNRILISRVRWPDFRRGISVFEEKDDLLPFEEAKLYGHNATHALLGYLARERDIKSISEVRGIPSLLELARAAFLEESGRALCLRHKGVDRLFTEAGYRKYAYDLLERMMNPHLHDTVERVIRDPRRKLAWNDRLVGTMRVAMREGVTPFRYAMGARAALEMLLETEGGDGDSLLEEIWCDSNPTRQEKEAVKTLIFQSGQRG